MTYLEQAVNEARQLVEEQAKDEGLWFIAATAPEAYLQAALRELHLRIESIAEIARHSQLPDIDRETGLAENV